MSLLPVSHTQFQLKSYWDQFFSKRSTPFEWYGQYTDLCHILHKYVKITSKTLVVGCGNSKLSEDMYDAGITDITNIDISEVVVKKMGARNFEKRAKMSFTQMDMLTMTFDDCVFECVLDKGTLDAIYSNTDDETVAKVRCMWEEIRRVLKTGGRYVCITLAQQHILNSLLETFSSGWLVRTHKVTLDDGKRDEKREVAGTLPVIVFILTKMASLPAKPAMKVLEVVREDGRCERCEDTEGVRRFVNAAQQHSMLLHHLKSVHPEETGIRVQYWSEKVPDVPRYTFIVVDVPKSKAKNGLFAIFIVPQGREGEWIFSSDSGLKGLAEQSCYHRLVVVTMHLGHQYGDLHQVKHEVTGSALAMLQSGVPSNIKLPILSTGEGVGRRVCLCEGVSSVSGQWRVEECGGGGGVEGEEEEEEGKRVRRLVFVKTSHLVQTEMRLRPAKSFQKKRKKKSKKASSVPPPLSPDPSHLCFTHHRAMLGSLCLTPAIVCSRGSDRGGGGVRGGGRGVRGRVLIIGLGGGALPTFIQRYLPQVSLDVCELDPELVDVAEKWFRFERGSTGGGGGGVNLHVEDGVSFVKNIAASLNEKKKKRRYSAIILDVDSKDVSVGMSSPPLAFVEASFLTAAKSLLADGGVLVTNVAARNEDMKLETLQALQRVFCDLVCIPLQEDINDIVVGTTGCPRSGVDCRNLFCSSNSNGSHTLLVGEDGASPDRMLTGQSAPEKVSTVEEGVRTMAVGSPEGKQMESDSLGPSMWRSSRVGDVSGVRERLRDLVSIVQENGGDVEGLEAQLTGLIMYRTL